MKSTDSCRMRRIEADCSRLKRYPVALPGRQGYEFTFHFFSNEEIMCREQKEEVL